VTIFGPLFTASIPLLAHSVPETPPKVPQILPLNDSDTGFRQIFDGKTLDGWDGDPAYWRAEDGELVGEVTEFKLLKRNSFIIWRGGKPKNFELKTEYRISELGNSGINYRSVETSGSRWVLRGPQADIDGQNSFSGQNYEEGGRTVLALRGDVTYIATGSNPRVVATLGTSDELKTFIKVNDWNRYHLIVRGNLMIHVLNGHIMSEVIDDDRINRRFMGLIGVQVHVGPPMKVEYRHVLLKTLD
jgi:3-keto-disaccharide hydrolase